MVDQGLLWYCLVLLLYVIVLWYYKPILVIVVVVLDTLKVPNLLDWTVYPEDGSGPADLQNPTWVFTSWTNPETHKVHQGLHICSVADREVDNWIRMPYIELPDVTNVFVNVSFFMRECQEYPGPLHRCRTHFQVLKYETDVDFATETTPAWNLNSYSMVQTVPAAHTYVNNQDPNIVANNYTFSFSKAKKGMYLAIRETGMCAFILSVQVYYRRCPATVIRHTNLAAVPSTSAISTVTGKCVDNAVEADPSEKLQFLCTHEGDWFNPSNSRGCVCKPGYYNTANACEECKVGTYKSRAANTECGVCPDNSVSTSRGLTECACFDGYYRAPDESPDSPCTKPPSEVRNLKVQTLNADTVTISWQPPSSLGGRSDLYYTVRCERCSTSVTYSPSRTQLTETSVTLSNLVPKTSYNVQIVAENGVYQVATPASTAPEVSFVTLESGSTPLAVPRKVESTSQSLSITWDSVPDATEYEVVYSPLSESNTHHTTKVQENKATLEELEPGTAYVVQISYFDDNQQLIGRSEESVFETDKPDNPNLMIGIAIVAVLVCMAIVIAIVVIFLRTHRSSNGPQPSQGGCVSVHKTILALFRSKQKCTDKPPSDCEGLGPYTNGTLAPVSCISSLLVVSIS
ncbi:hypothetical protein EB796_008855 [Bugula neritina]|uniref:Uncharacterized protein n=1 Tax=Bugula neritina TaxID=10212 RepID=A0A7J7K2E0_BUGNE|nr:hypothetical protein EB796_008855 [Bugula neritina]